MANKLHDVFSNEMFSMELTLKFKDHTAKEKFQKALQQVNEEGHAVPVDEVDFLKATIQCGPIDLPILIEDNITHFVVGPSVEHIPLTLETDDGKIELELLRRKTKSSVQIKFVSSDVLSFSITHKTDEPNLKFTYHIYHDKAETVNDLVFAYRAIVALINRFFCVNSSEATNDAQESLLHILNGLKNNLALWKKISSLETVLQGSFSPSKFDYSSEDILDVNELYAMLIEKKVIRLNRKITFTDETMIAFEPDSSVPKEGEALTLAFSKDIHYILCGYDFHVYTVNLLLNAVVKESHLEENGTIKVLYGDIDSKPVLIASRAYLTKAEANQEFEIMMNHKGLYVNAKSL